MIKIPYTKKMLKDSKDLASKMGSLKNSITEGAGNRAGFLGELALMSFLGAARDDKKGYDLLLNGKKIEVKSKRRTCPPRDYFEGSVAETSLHQRPDFYAFLSLTFGEKKIRNGKEIYDDLLSVWFCGVISFQEFMGKSRQLKKGQKDGQFTVKADMRNIKYSELYFWS